MTYTLPQLALLFFIYAFLGWCTEVAYAACCEGRFVNRGFLNGPVCPIYGFGMVGVMLALEPFGDNIAVLFIGSMLLTTSIEFVTGFVLEKVFHAKWWDYSDMRFNIMGYVCLMFSLIWGVGCVAMVKLVHPVIYGLVCEIPQPLMVAMLCVFAAAMIVDIAATLASIRRLNERLKLLTELAAEIHTMSDGIGQVISDGTLAAKSKAMTGEEKFSEGMRKLGEIKSETGARIDQGRRAMTDMIDRSRETMTELLDQSKRAVSSKLGQSAEGSKRRLKALKKRFAAAIQERSFGQNRLLAAFPHLKSYEHQEAMNALRESYARLNKKRRK